MKKIILVLGLLSFIFLGGIVMIFGFGDSILEQKERTVQKKEEELTLTKEQQDNVVRRIVRGYDPITQVEFTEFMQHEKTGTYYLFFTINNDDNLKAMLPVTDLSRFDDDTSSIGLGPINDFAYLKRIEELSQSEDVNISAVKIIYLED
ncbi:hypothetical protein ACVRYP_08415 [Streptococcus rifensis]